MRILWDDDPWSFINRKLAIDPGDVHAAEAPRVALDDATVVLCIMPGSMYPLDPLTL